MSQQSLCSSSLNRMIKNQGANEQQVANCSLLNNCKCHYHHPYAFRHIKFLTKLVLLQLQTKIRHFSHQAFQNDVLMQMQVDSRDTSAFHISVHHVSSSRPLTCGCLVHLVRALSITPTLAPKINIALTNIVQ